MSDTYHALLTGNRLEWQGEKPQTGDTVTVRVTVLGDDDGSENGAETAQGERMAAVLEHLALLGTFAEESDPAQWEKEQRQERDLPRS